MRGSGAKGIPRTPKGLRKYETKEDLTTPLATNGWFRFWYVAAPNSFGGSITFVDHAPLLGDKEYVFDLGRSCLVGGIGCGSFLSFDIYWSHDGLRWYGHHSPTLAEKWSDEDDGQDLIQKTPGVALLWRKPVPRARYWKLVYPEIQSINPVRHFSFFLYEERNPCVLHDHNENNYKQLLNSNYGAHTPRVINRSRTFDFGVAPDLLWLTAYTYTEFNFRLYVPTAQQVRQTDLKSSYRQNAEQIVQATKRGYTFGRALWDRNDLWFVPAWHPNSVSYSGSPASYKALALKTNPEAGVAVKVGSPSTKRIRHGFGHVPDLVVFADISTFLPYVDVNIKFLSKEFPDVYFMTSVYNPDSVAKVTAWDRDGWDVDSEYFYIKEYAEGQDILMVALDSSTTHRAKRAFGKYTGNGSSSGPTVSGLGFQPDFIGICKVSTTASTGYNGIYTDINGVTFYRWLTSDSIDDANLGYVVEYLADGFRLINADNRVNQSGYEYFWWAEYEREE